MPDAAKPMTVAVDVMGGDRAPHDILAGCLSAPLEPGETILLVGDENIIRPALDAADLGDTAKQYKVVHADEAIGMHESPVEALRQKKWSSIGICVKLVADGQADVFLSAGNTGACVAASQLKMRTLAGVARPGIAVVIPTFSGPVVLCDAGANVDPQPHHLLHYGIMASAYAKAVCGIESPRVGLVSVGEEESKGNDLTKEAHKLLRRADSIDFVGNVEGREFFAGKVDVAVCDGFVGNVLLKSFEGVFDGLFRMMAREVGERKPEMLGNFKQVLGAVRARHDWQEYGAAPLLGVNGYTLIAHGASDARTIQNALVAGRRLVASRVNEKIVGRVADAPAEPAVAAASL